MDENGHSRFGESVETDAALPFQRADKNQIEGLELITRLGRSQRAVHVRIEGVADQDGMAHALRFQLADVVGFCREEEVPEIERLSERPLEIVRRHDIVRRVVDEQRSQIVADLDQYLATQNLRVVDEDDGRPLTARHRDEPLVFGERIDGPAELPAQALIERE